MQESDKHSPRIDDQMKHDTAHLVEGAPVENRDESRRDQAPAEGEPDLNSGDRPDLDEAPGTGITETDAEQRAELARHVESSVFPARRDELLASAERMQAPGSVLALLRRLPGDELFENLQAAWQAAGGAVEGHHTDPA